MTPTLQTARLVLRPLELSDAAQAQPLFAQWEIVQHLNAKVPWPFPSDGVETYYREVALPAIARGEEWHWTLRLQSNPSQLIGSIGLMLDQSKPNHTNRGFWLAQPWQNQGLMTEAVIAVNDYWFNTLEQPILRTAKAVANITSRRISQKTGMTLVDTGTADYVSGHLPSETWQITAQEWQSWKSQNHSHPH